MKNPFFVPKFFGQNQTTSSVQTGGKFCIFTNVLFVLFYLVCFLFAFFSMDDKFGAKGYGFISHMKFAAQFYEMAFFTCFVSLTTTYRRKSMVESYLDLQKIFALLEKINISYKFTFKATYLSYAFLFTTAIAAITIDVTVGESNSIPFWITLHLPGLFCWVYITQVTVYYTSCTSIFKALNGHLKKMSGEEMTCLEKLSASKENRRPEDLFKRIPNEDVNVFEKIFVLHDETCEIARLVNDNTGYEYFMFMAIATTATLSLIYDVCMDLMNYSKGSVAASRPYYCCDYWACMYGIAIAWIVSTASGLSEQANATKWYLHKLRNLYEAVEEHFDLFSLQLVHQHLEITAANFFVFDRSVIYKLIGAFATYIIILMDLETEDDTVNAN